MTRWFAVLSSLLALALVAAGCGGGNDNGNGGGTKVKTPSTPPGSTGKTASVSMKNIQFSPKSLTVKPGTKVKWTNDDSVAHDVTKKGGPGSNFSSGKGNLQQGDTYEQTLKTPGTVKYVCTVHPGMEGTITVK